MNYIQRLWRSLWNHPLVVGDPLVPETWQTYLYREFNSDIPPFHLAQLVFTGGIRLLMFRWLAVYDPWREKPYYQPLLWFEYVPGLKEQSYKYINGRHFIFRYVVPWRRGQLTVVFPLSWDTFRVTGLADFWYDSWLTENPTELKPLEDGIARP